MRKLLFSLGLTALMISPAALSRDTMSMQSIADAMSSATAKEKLGSDISFYFADNKTPKTKKALVEAVANRKTNSFNKTDAEACNWAFLSAMLALRDRAVREGGNGVVEIVSYYKKKEMSSGTEFECHAGTFVTGVALKGKIVKL